jgi:hypothetical protein
VTYSLKLGPLQKSVVEVEVLGSIYADPDSDESQTQMADAILEHFTRTGQLLVKPDYRDQLLALLDIESGDAKLDNAAVGIVMKIIKHPRE